MLFYPRLQGGVTQNVGMEVYRHGAARMEVGDDVVAERSVALEVCHQQYPRALRQVGDQNITAP